MKSCTKHGLKAAHPFLLDRDVVGEIRAPADIDHRRAQRLVERHRRAAEAPDSRTIAQRLAKRASEHQADILDRVMVVNLEVTVGGDLEIEEAVAGETFQHVIEERHAG